MEKALLLAYTSNGSSLRIFSELAAVQLRYTQLMNTNRFLPRHMAAELLQLIRSSDCQTVTTFRRSCLYHPASPLINLTGSRVIT